MKQAWSITSKPGAITSTFIGVYSLSGREPSASVAHASLPSFVDTLSSCGLVRSNEKPRAEVDLPEVTCPKVDNL
jgi:hypothetical protein